VDKLNWMMRMVISVVLFGCAGCVAWAQTEMNKPAPQQPSNCKNMPYLHQDQFNRQPIELSDVHGTVVDKNGVVLENVCVGLFSDDNRQLLRYARTDTNGRFSIDVKGLPDGTYRLVGQFIEFCPANAIVEVNSHSREKQQLVLRMNLRGATTATGTPELCSTVELKK
jgi:Carboxypeptidase regulatory-like domain